MFNGYFGYLYFKVFIVILFNFNIIHAYFFNFPRFDLLLISLAIPISYFLLSSLSMISW